MIGWIIFVLCLLLFADTSLTLWAIHNGYSEQNGLMKWAVLNGWPAFIETMAKAIFLAWLLTAVLPIWVGPLFIVIAAYPVIHNIGVLIKAK